jgi:hypothetical protein
LASAISCEHDDDDAIVVDVESSERLGAADVTAFVSWLAGERRVSASTQNQALSAVLFLYRDVLGIELQGPAVVCPGADARAAAGCARP